MEAPRSFGLVGVGVPFDGLLVFGTDLGDVPAAPGLRVERENSWAMTGVLDPACDVWLAGAKRRRNLSTSFSQ